LSVAVGEGVVVVSCAPVDDPAVELVVADPDDGIGVDDDEADGAADDVDGGADEVAPALEDAGGGVIADAAGDGDVGALGVVAVEVPDGAGVSDDALSVGLF